MFLDDLGMSVGASNVHQVIHQKTSQRADPGPCPQRLFLHNSVVFVSPVLIFVLRYQEPQSGTRTRHGDNTLVSVLFVGKGAEADAQLSIFFVFHVAFSPWAIVVRNHVVQMYLSAVVSRQ